MKETKQNILFHCDADRSRGMGHLFRCRMLYGRLAGPGSSLAVKPDSAARGLLESSRLPWREISPPSAGGELGLELAEIAGETGARVVLLDRKDNSRELVLTLRRQGLLVVALEDTGPGRLEADILVDPHVQPGSAEAACDGRALCCFGPGWALIDPCYVAARANGAADRHADDTGPLRVAVSLGGSDPAGLTRRVLAALAKVDEKLEIELVAGPGADTGQVPGTLRHDIRIHRGLDNLAKLLATCSLAFVSGGITMFETLCVGVATVVVPQHEEQYTNASRLASRGALLVVPPPAEKSSVIGLILAAREIAGNEALRRKLVSTGAALVDGRGVQRLESRLHSLLGDMTDKDQPAANAV